MRAGLQSWARQVLLPCLIYYSFLGLSRDVQGPWEPVYVGRVHPTALYRNHRGEQAHAVSLTHTAHPDGSLSPLEWGQC